jgi:hypothetical protein
MEMGEPAEVKAPQGANQKEKPKPGKLSVKVLDVHSKSPVEGAEVYVRKKKLLTNKDGLAEAGELPEGGYSIRVYKAFPSENFFKFLLHYPKSAISFKAESEVATSATVKSGETTVVQVEFEVYKPLEKVILERRHIDLNGPDKYGHWWTVIDGVDSYGWWPKYPMGHPNNRGGPPPEAPPPLSPDAGTGARIQHMFDRVVHSTLSKLYSLKESSLARTFRGVEGELNGCTSFGGRAKRYGHGANIDPHAMQGDSGDDRFQPILHDGRSEPALKNSMHQFANRYSGGWSWRFEFGKNCHSFQISMMNECNLKDFKSL